MENESLVPLMDRVLNKLDLLLELVKAQKEEDWKRVDEVCKELDKLKEAA